MLQQLVAQRVPGADYAHAALRANPQLGWTNIFAVQLIVRPRGPQPLSVRLVSSGVAATQGCANVLADAESCAPRHQQRYG